MRKLPFSTAQADVLLRLTTHRRANRAWSLKDGTALYESRALTNTLCQSLVQHGFLDEKLKDNTPVYTVNAAGWRKADELRYSS